MEVALQERDWRIHGYGLYLSLEVLIVMFSFSSTWIFFPCSVWRFTIGDAEAGPRSQKGGLPGARLTKPTVIYLFYLKFTQRFQTPVYKHHGVFNEEEEVQVPRPFHSRGADGCAVYQRDALLQNPTFGRRWLCDQFI